MGEYFLNRIFFCLILIFYFLYPATGFADDDSFYIEKYFQLLSSGTDDEKKLALQNLPRLLNDPKFKDNPATFIPVLNALKDSDPSIREAAAASLKRFGRITKGRFHKDKIIASLLKALADSHHGVRRETIKALGFYQDERAVGPLIDILKQDPDPWVRLEAAYALGQFNARKAVPALIDALKGNNTDWRNKIVKQECVIALKKIGYRDTALIQLFIENANDAYLKAEIIKALGQFRSMAAKDVLFQATRDPAPVIRKLAIQAIGQLPLVRTGGMDSDQHPKYDLFVESLQDSSAGVRAAAAKALGQTGDKRAVKPLLDVLHDKDRAVQKQVIEALGRFRDKSILTALVPFLGSSTNTVSSMSFLSIAKKTADGSVFVCRKNGVRYAVKKYSEIPMVLEENKPFYPPNSIEKLISDYPTSAEKHPKYESRTLRKVSKRVSYNKHIVHPEAVNALIYGLNNPDAGARVKVRIIEMFQSFEDDRIEPLLIDLLDDQSSSIRFAAMLQLHHFVTQKSQTALIKVLDDKNRSMREKAARRLGLLKDKQAIQLLFKELDDSDAEVRKTVLSALQHFDDPKVTDANIRMLKDESKYVRKTAVRNIKMRPDKKAVESLISILAGQSNEELAAQKAYVQAIERFGAQSVPKLDAQAIQEFDLQAAQAAYKRSEKKLDKQKIKELKVLGVLSAYYHSALQAEQEMDVLAAQALGVIGDKRAVDPLIEALNGKFGQNQKLMVTAARVLSAFEDNRILPHLIKKVGMMKKAEHDSPFLVSTQRVLNRHEETERADILKHYLHNTDKEIKKGAVYLLGMYQDKKAVAHLEILLDDPDPEIMAYTKKIIAGIKSGSFQKSIKSKKPPLIVQGLIPIMPEKMLPPVPKPARTDEQSLKGRSRMITRFRPETVNMAPDPMASLRKNEQKINQYLEMLSRGNEAERKEALEKIFKFVGIPECRNNPEIFIPILNALIDKAPSIREAAAVSLEKIGEKTRNFNKDSNIAPALVMALVDEDPGVRRHAAKALVLYKDKLATAPLIERLYDESPRVRSQAAVSLGRLKADGAGPALLDLFHDETDWDQKSIVRNECLIAMRKLGYRSIRSVPILIENYNDETLQQEIVKALGRFYSSDKIRDLLIKAGKDDNEKVRNAAIKSMARFSSARPGVKAKDASSDFEFYIQAMSDPSPEVRITTVKALAETGDERAIEPIINALHDKDNDVQSAAVCAVGKFNDDRILIELLPFFGSQSGTIRMNAKNSFSNVARKTGQGEVYVYREQGTRFVVKNRNELPRHASWSKSIIHPDAVEKLIDASGSNDMDVKKGVLHGIGLFEDDRIESWLIRLLADPSLKIRRYALRPCLYHFATDRAVPDIIKVLEDPNAEVRRDAAWLLGVLENKEAVLPLLNTLNDSHTDVKLKVIFALGHIKDKRAIEPLRERLSDSNDEIRKVALFSLSRLDDPKISSLNIKMLKDESPDVRITAINNIKKKPDKSAVEPLILLLGDPEMNYRSAAALGVIGDARAEAPLIKALNGAYSQGLEPDADRYFKDSVARALGNLGGKKAVKSLLDIMESDSQETYLKFTAVNSLGKIGDKTATIPLIKILSDKESDVELRAASASALGEIGDKRAVDPLVKSTNEILVQVRHASEEALKKMGSFP